MKNIVLVLSLVALLALYGCAASPIKEGMGSNGRAYRGAADAKLKIYEYSDFECPFCGKAQPVVEEVLRAYPNDVKLEFRHNPLPIHPRAMPSAIAAVCAEEQGKFWPLHDRMFANQQALSDADLRKYAADIGLDAEKFASCIASSEASAKVRKDMTEAAAVGVVATPTFKIGESAVIGAQPFPKFKSVIDSELARLG